MQATTSECCGEPQARSQAKARGGNTGEEGGRLHLHLVQLERKGNALVWHTAEAKLSMTVTAPAQAE